MIFSCRAIILASVASSLILSACDQNTSNDSSGDVGLNNISFYEKEYNTPSWAGSYLSSRVAQNRFDWPAAVSFLSQTISEKPDDNTLARRSMVLALGAGDAATAEKWAKKFDQQPDQTGLTHFIRLINAIKLNDIAAARNILAHMPDNALSKFARPLITAWIDAGEQKTLRQSTNRPSLNSLSGNGVYTFHRILIADYLGQLDGDLAPLSLAQTHNAITTISAEQLGDIFLRHHQFDLALSFYKMVQSANPNITGLDARIKAAQEKQDSLPAPLVITPPISSSAQGVALALFDMASTFYNDQSYESAIIFARMSLILSPDLDEPKLLVANILADQKRLNDAIAIYQKIPSSDPRYVAIQQKIASLRVDQGEDMAAIDTLQTLADQSTDTGLKINYLMQIGNIHRENENFKSALAAYDAAANIAGDPPKSAYWDLYYARGMTLERLKKWDRAEADLKTALAFQPDHPYIMNYLGYSWADQGVNLDDAMKLLLRAVSIVPDDGYVTDSVGWAYYKQGKYTQAVEYLERAVELLPYDSTVNDHLGDAYAKVGRHREAQFQWQRALNYGEDEAAKDVIRKKLD